MEINEQKRKKFMQNAGKRVNNVMHNIQILEPMARSNSYDFTKEDVEKMFCAMQEMLDMTKAEFYKKFEEKTKSEKKLFSFDDFQYPVNENTSNEVSEVIPENAEIVEETEVPEVSATKDIKENL